MLKVEYSKNYSKKERTDSETLKEIQYVKQLNSQIRSKHSDDIIKLPENFEVVQQLQEQYRSNQDSFIAADGYNRLNQVTFDSDDSDNPGAWAGIDQINSYINNQAIKTSANGNKLAYYIGPNNFGFDSKEGIKDIAKHICRRDDIPNSFYGTKESLDKPFIVVSKSLFIIFSEAKQRKQERPFAG